MSYRMIYDIHTHTTFSHGKGSIEDNVKAAAEKGLSAIGIADHGPGHVSYGVKRENFAVMRREIQRLRPLYPQMEILLGVEANIMNPDGSLDVTETEKVQLDYVLAGYHYGVFGQAKVRALAIHGSNLLHLPAARKANTRRVVRALRENEIKILTHPGDKGPVDLEEIARACSLTGTLMEISTWHKDLTVEGIRTCSKYDVSFVISSDAHSPQRVGSFEAGLERAVEAGLDLERIVNIEKM